MEEVEIDKREEEGGEGILFFLVISIGSFFSIVFLSFPFTYKNVPKATKLTPQKTQGFI